MGSGPADSFDFRLAGFGIGAGLGDIVGDIGGGLTDDGSPDDDLDTDFDGFPDGGGDDGGGDGPDGDGTGGAPDDTPADDTPEDAGLDAEGVLDIAYLYEAALDRNGDVDAAGLNHWVDIREAGFGLAEIAGFFLASAEYAAKFGDPAAQDDRAFLETLYGNILDRDSDTDGIGFWEAALAGGTVDRPAVLLAFAGSAENLGQTDFGGTLTEVGDGVWDFV
ncbi:hypothetical protein LNKW23_15040 [Paralimibaculum aggregatum]|uniref:DUF4214 domain-containing protein n=1 Tax=Paralimibaculum aggregatum TaxID=3036245 RepID=A0ABQ6LG44_9RHOB|nr:DUF4214 domain-containing protein [Limibaculum sp. NKW23]GMG82291.1 hypothetical protein LNKW23_15040 [Limibaculum sp. NKW23]